MRSQKSGLTISKRCLRIQKGCRSSSSSQDEGLGWTGEEEYWEGEEGPSAVLGPMTLNKNAWPISPIVIRNFYLWRRICGFLGAYWCLLCIFFKWSYYMCLISEKNPTYGRQRISRPMRIVGPIQFLWKGCLTISKKMFDECQQFFWDIIWDTINDTRHYRRVHSTFCLGLSGIFSRFVRQPFFGFFGLYLG